MTTHRRSVLSLRWAVPSMPLDFSRAGNEGCVSLPTHCSGPCWSRAGPPHSLRVGAPYDSRLFIGLATETVLFVCADLCGCAAANRIDLETDRRPGEDDCKQLQ